MSLAASASHPVYPAIAELLGTPMAMTDSSTPVHIHMVLDVQRLWEHLGGDTNLLCELTDLFVRNYPLYLQAIRQALLQRNRVARLEGALTVKGMVSNFGATEALEAATQLETFGQQENLHQAAETYLTLDRTLRRLANALRRLSGIMC